MSKIEDGGPAFPIPGDQYDEDFNGMSLRDYFAAKAMHAIMSTPKLMQVTSDDVSSLSYQMADAMLKAREKGGAQ